jgi:hypothetical protein
MNYEFRVLKQFWDSFYALPNAQKDSVRRAWKIFKANPFDPRLGVHKIRMLSAKYKRTIFSVVVEGDLRVVFYIDGSKIITADVGTHDIYKG